MTDQANTNDLKALILKAYAFCAGMQMFQLTLAWLGQGDIDQALFDFELFLKQSENTMMGKNKNAGLKVITRR